jgi:predicted nucleotide-binding protein
MRVSFKQMLKRILGTKTTMQLSSKSIVVFENFFRKNRIFIGSSLEGKNIATKVISELRNQNIEPLPWFDYFKNSRPPLQELEQISLDIDGAILIGTPEDKAIIRQKKWSQMRDNVLYEYGLFSGIIGRSKCSLIVPDKEDFRIPSDFLGVSCYKTYNDDNVGQIISEVISLLVDTMSKPKADETTKTRGLRLLRFVGWIRNESFRIAQEWNKDTTKKIIANRIVAVSGFIHDDLTILGLDKEYKRIEKVVLESVDNFPLIYRGSHYRDLVGEIEGLAYGHIRPHPGVLEGLLYFMTRPYGQYCHVTCNYLGREKNGIDSSYRSLRDRPICNCHAWALGAAEAATLFENVAGHNNHLLALDKWADRFLPNLNQALIAFESKLHEDLFGSL